MTSIIVVGSGNVASSFCKLIKDSKLLLLKAVIARNEVVGNQLASKFGTSFSPFGSKQLPSADLVVIAVSDTAIAEAAAIKFAGKPILVHTAGAISKEVLAPFAQEYGVLYPLQSLNKKENSTQGIPMLYDGSKEAVIVKLAAIALQLSSQTFKVSDEDRMKYHLSAVFVNNFSNHLFTIAHDYCTKNHLDFSLLLPLIKATAEKVTASSPAALQTGPAVRKDKITMEKHVELLKGEEDMRRMYELFTQAISKRSNI